MEAGTGDVLSQLRSACGEVAATARHVGIDVARLDEYAVSFAPDELARTWTETDPFYLLADERARAAYALCVNAVNFGSGWFPRLRKRAGMSGSYTIASGLKEWFERDGVPAAARLAVLTAEACAAMFGQDLA